MSEAQFQPETSFRHLGLLHFFFASFAMPGAVKLKTSTSHLNMNGNGAIYVHNHILGWVQPCTCITTHLCGTTCLYRPQRRPNTRAPGTDTGQQANLGKQTPCSSVRSVSQFRSVLPKGDRRHWPDKRATCVRLYVCVCVCAAQGKAKKASTHNSSSE